MVACLGRRLDALAETQRMILAEGSQAHAVRCDVSDMTSVSEAFSTVSERVGPVDILFNNAGRFRSVGPLWNADPQDWWEDVTVNLFGSFISCRAVLPSMIKRDVGIIINMDGGGGSEGPLPGGSGYGCSKAALVRMTECLARELERIGSSVLVFAMNPGFVRTDMTETIAAAEQGAWLEFVRQSLREDSGLSPGQCGIAALKLISIATPDLNGCTFSTLTDFEKIAKRSSDIAANRHCTLRLSVVAS